MDKRPRKALLAPLTKVAGLFCTRSLIEGCVLLLRLRIRRNTAGPSMTETTGATPPSTGLTRSGAILRLSTGSRLHRTGLAGANKPKTVPALIRPLGVRPNRLRKEDTYH